MSLYQTIRPKNFEEFFGNIELVKSLKVLAKNDSAKQPHCILLHGPTGCGKTTLARILADCFGAHKEMGIFEYNASNTRGIDTIREISDNCQASPVIGKSKVYIVDECHSITPQAQESFLKVLEDCPSHVYFILCTTEPEKLIKTIRNRCVEYKVSLLSRPLLKQLVLEAAKKIGFNVSDEICDALVIVSEGSPRAALVNLEMISGLTNEEDMITLLEKGGLSGGDMYELVDILCSAPEVRSKKVARCVELITFLDSDPENIRKGVLNLVAYKLKSCKSPDILMDYSKIIKVFCQSTFYHGKSMLYSMVIDACLL